MALGDRLREFRIRHRMTQADVAEELRTSRPLVASWESGRVTPNTQSMVKLANLLGCPLGDLVSEIGTEPEMPSISVWKERAR